MLTPQFSANKPACVRCIITFFQVKISHKVACRKKRSHTRRQTYLFENTTVKAEINALGLGKKVVSKKLETIWWIVKKGWRYLNQRDYFYTQQIFFSPQWKMGQWPIFSGASLPLPRLALPPLLHISPSLPPSSLLLSLALGFWTDKCWQCSPPHWTPGRL